MIVENTFFAQTLYILLISFVIGFFILYLIYTICLKRHRNLSHPYNPKIITFASICGGAAFSFMSTITISCLMPTMVTIHPDYSYESEYSFTYGHNFLGIGGCYIVNESKSTLKLVGFNDDSDISISIKPYEIARSRKCPEAYFCEPSQPSILNQNRIRHRKFAKGRRRNHSRPTTLYLIIEE